MEIEVTNENIGSSCDRGSNELMDWNLSRFSLCIYYLK